jgi:hypothetical protein
VTSRNQGLSFASRRSKKDPGNKVGTVWNFTTEVFTFTQTGTTTIKLLKISTSKQ